MFLLGLVLGSFFHNMHINLKQDKNWIRGFSACDSCQRNLHFFHKIPFISYLLLRGRCAYCKAPIPLSYFCWELFFALFLHLLTYLQLSLSDILIILLLISLTIIDYHRYEIAYPPLILISLIIFFSMPQSKDFLFNLLIILPLALACSYHKMGWGDLQLILPFTWLFTSSALLLWLQIAALSGLIYALLQQEKKAAIPFVPFLCLSFIITVIRIRY